MTFWPTQWNQPLVVPAADATRLDLAVIVRLRFEGKLRLPRKAAQRERPRAMCHQHATPETVLGTLDAFP